jgi:hypothetical protein
MSRDDIITEYKPEGDPKSAILPISHEVKVNTLDRTGKLVSHSQQVNRKLKVHLGSILRDKW